MHALGGFWVGLCFIWLLKTKDLSFNSIAKIALGVLLIGIFWEMFEILVNRVIAQNPFNYLDTLSDIFFDLTGAFISVFYFIKRIMLKEESEL
jgi:hypothetical protein